MTGDSVQLEGTPLWAKFERDFLMRPGTHILGLGQTGTGKTMYKGIRINKWLVERAHETLYIVDCGKPGEVLPYAHFGLPLNFIIPMGCDVHVSGSPVDIHKHYAASPEECWDYVRKDEINIFTFRYHTLEAVVKAEYMARFVEVLIDQVMRQTLSIPLPGILHVDECSGIIGSEALWEDVKTQRVMAARISSILKMIRFMGLRAHFLDQSYKDIYPAARRQFPYLLLSRSPGTENMTELGLVKKYSFNDLRVDEARLIFPQRNWVGTWKGFKRLDAPEGMTIKYFGEVQLDRSPVKKRKFIGSGLSPDPVGVEV